MTSDPSATGARLVLLGTGTCQLEDGRAATAALIEWPGSRLVFDFGRGTAGRLVELGLRQDQVGHVALSHFHPDHWSDLVPYLQAAAHSRTDPRQTDLEIHATAEVIAKLRRLFDLFAPGELVVERYRVRLRTVREGRIEISGRSFEFVHLPPAGNHGLRWRAGAQTWALTGDSHFHRREIEFLRGVDLAVIDAGHLSDGDIVELAIATGVRRLVCSHLYRDLDLDRLRRAAADGGYRGELSIARDLDSFASARG